MASKLRHSKCTRELIVDLYQSANDNTLLLAKNMEKGSEESDSELVLCYPPKSRMQGYPWLIIFDGEKNERQTFYSITDDQYYIRHIPAMQNKVISSCCHGWLFLETMLTSTTMRADCCLFNMLTMEKLQLPPLSSRNGLHNFVLSSPPTDDNADCRILAFRFYRVNSCYLGDAQFNPGILHNDDDPIVAATTFQGKLFTLRGNTYNLSTAGLNDPNLDPTPVILGEATMGELLLETDNAQYYLVESCGELLFVYTNSYDTHDGLYVKIFKADLNNKEWVMLNSLGDRAIFLDECKGLSSPASEFGLRRDCVYYVNPSDRNLYIYDLEDRSITMALPCPVVNSKDVTPLWAI